MSNNIPAELKYVASHEWLRLEEDGTITVGITHHAQELLVAIHCQSLPDTAGNCIHRAILLKKNGKGRKIGRAHV